VNIKVGDPFPAVKAKSQSGDTVDLATFQGRQNVVLYFYPKDLTPGCTREAIDFDRKLGEFKALDTAVLGMSVDPVEAHQNFAASCGLNFPLLADEGRAVSERLGILTEIPQRPDLGKIARRTTFVIDKQGVLREVFEVQQVDGHVDEVLEAVRRLS
jgi:peroxiredoxin Q/BCP